MTLWGCDTPLFHSATLREPPTDTLGCAPNDTAHDLEAMLAVTGSAREESP